MSLFDFGIMVLLASLNELSIISSSAFWKILWRTAIISAQFTLEQGGH